MANDLNQCNFIGRLGRDPETRYSASGDAVTNFTIAVGWKSKDKEGAEWVPVVAFGKLGEICGQYLKKGAHVFVSGRFKTEKYTDKEGVERYSTKIMADAMQMLGARQSGNDDSTPNPRQQRNDTPPSSRPAPNFSDMDSDIPF
jgi:single-strand DNA-binding protein